MTTGRTRKFRSQLVEGRPRTLVAAAVRSSCLFKCCSVAAPRRDWVACTKHCVERHANCDSARRGTRECEESVHVVAGCGVDRGSAAPCRRLLRHAGECLDGHLQWGGTRRLHLSTAPGGFTPMDCGAPPKPPPAPSPRPLRGPARPPGP